MLFWLSLLHTLLTLQVLTTVIKTGGPALQLRATDVMLSAIQHDPVPLRHFMRSQKDHELFHLLVRSAKQSDTCLGGGGWASCQTERVGGGGCGAGMESFISQCLAQCYGTCKAVALSYAALHLEASPHSTTACSFLLLLTILCIFLGHVIDGS